jgi:hypothetical protein
MDTNGVPSNFAGYQYAYHGQSYTGLAVFYKIAPNYREYVQSKLTQPLIQNNIYCTKFFVSSSDSCRYSSKQIGAYFSDTLIFSSDTNLFQFFYLSSPYYSPQVENNQGFISDTVGWTEVNGIFTAQGGEEYIIIGNFKNDTLTDTLFTQNTSPGFSAAYYYLDDVSVEEVKTARAVNDTLLCVNADSVMIGINVTENASYSWQPSTGLSDANAPNPKAKPTVTTTYYVTKTQCSVVSTDSVTISIYDCNIYPLAIPTLITTNEYWELKHLEPNTQVWLYNSIGQLVYKEGNYQNKLNAQLLASGIYIYNIETARGDFYKGKLEVVK